MKPVPSKCEWIAIGTAAVLLALGAVPVRAVTTSWVNPAGGTWSNPANWDAGVPGASDDAVIATAGTYSVTLDLNATVASLTLGGASGVQTLTATSRTLTLGGASAVNANGALMMSSSVVTGTGSLTNGGSAALTTGTVGIPLANQGTLVFQGTSTMNGALTTGAGSTLRVQGSSTVGTASLTMAVGFTNNGAVELTSTGNAQLAALTVTAGTLVNAPGRTISALAGSGGTRSLVAELDNQGQLSVGAALAMNKASADHVNPGWIDVSGGDLTIIQSGTTPTFTTAGTLTLAPGRTMSVSGGAFLYQGGPLSGGGTLSFSSSVVTLDAGLSNADVALALVGTTVNGPGTLTNAGTMSPRSCTVNAPLDNQGTLTFQSTSAVNGALTTGSGTTLRVEGNNTVGTGALTVANGFTNNGTVELTSAGNAQAATLAVTAGTLVNPPGRTISALAGAGGSRTLSAELNNQGQLSVGATLVMNKASADHVNLGWIDVSGGNLTLTQSGTTPTFTTAGTLTVAAGRTLGVSGGSWLHQGGPVSGGGTLSFTSAILTLDADFSNTAVALTFSGATVNGPATLTNVATLSPTSSTINAPLVNQGTLTFQGTSAVNGALTTGSGTMLRVEGSNTVGTATLAVATGFTNNGAIELTSTGNPQAATLSVASGTLTNAPGRTISALAGTGGARTLTAELNNQGQLSVGAPLTINKPSADHVNAGWIDVAGGDLTLNQSGTSPTFTTAGTLTIAPGRTLAFTGGGLAYEGGPVTGGGSVSLSAVVATLVASFTNSDVALAASGSTVNGPGTLTNVGTIPMTGCTVNAVLENQATLVFQGTSAVNGSLVSGAGSTLRVQGSNLVGTAALTVASGFINNGTVELTSIGNPQAAILSVSSGTLVNAPGRTLDAQAGAGGTRTVTAQLDNQGLLTVGAPLTINKASADHLNSGTLDVSGGNLTLSQTATTPTFSSSGTLTLGAGRTMTVTGGTLANTAAGFIRGGGTLDVGGTSFSNAGTISPGLSPAILGVTGNCPSSASAALDIEIGGLTPGTEHDRLAVTGTATLAGALRVSLLPGFCASPGDSFRVVTAGTRSGTFNGIVVSGKGNVVLDPHYDATGLTLLTVSNAFTLTASAGPGGSISPAGTVSVGCGATQAFTITPDPCHRIVDVLVDGASVGPVDDYTFTYVTEDHTISVTFALIVYTITADAGPGGTITPSGAVGVGCGSTQAFTIAPNAGFQIVDVLVDGGSVGPLTDYTFPIVGADHTIHATFLDVQPPAVQVVAPNGGETWDALSTQVIRWTATDNAAVDSVNVDYSLDGPGGPWVPVQHGVAGADSVEWSIPDVGTLTAVIRATAFDAVGNVAEDLSDAAFRIRGPTDVPTWSRPSLALQVAPNPARTGDVRFQISLPEAGAATVEVLSVAGRRVWKGRVVMSAPGHRDVEWGGRDSGGQRVGPGFYLVRLQSPWGDKTSRLILLR